MEITERAKQHILLEILRLRDKLPSVYELTRPDKGSFSFGYVEDQYDNKRGENGENEFFVAKKAHWYIGFSMGVDGFPKKHLTDLGDFWFYGEEIPKVKLDYNGDKFTANGAPVEQST